MSSSFPQNQRPLKNLNSGNSPRVAPFHRTGKCFNFYGYAGKYAIDFRPIKKYIESKLRHNKNYDDDNTKYNNNDKIIKLSQWYKQ